MKNKFIRYIYCSEKLYTDLIWDFETIETFFTTGTMPENFTDALANKLIGHHMAFNAMIQLAQAKVPVTEELLNEFHKMLLCDSNEYRDDLDDHLMQHFIDQMTASAYLPPVEYAVQCHRRLLEIHPWASCNGEVAMLLMNYMLISRGLSLACIEDAGAYASAMKVLNQDLNAAPMMELVERSI